MYGCDCRSPLCLTVVLQTYVTVLSRPLGFAQVDGEGPDPSWTPIYLDQLVR